jgi:ABC-type Fe3+-hydroxamate transport system substrate-binding protein
MGRLDLRLDLLALAASTLLLLGTAACGERSEPTGTSARLYPVTMQSGDRPLVVTSPAERIAVLDPGPASIIRALGAGSKIVAQPAPARIDFDTLRRRQPDLIVAAADTDERDLGRAASLTHADVYTAPGGSIREVERAITQLGLLVDQPIRARSLVRRIERQRQKVRERLAHARRASVFVDTGFFTTVSDQSLIGNLVREAHGRNVVGASPPAGPIKPADLLRLDPAVYLATSDSMLTLADLRRNPTIRKVRAVRTGRFAIVDVGLLRAGPRIGRALVEIARLLHPNAFR